MAENEQVSDENVLSFLREKQYKYEQVHPTSMSTWLKEIVHTDFVPSMDLHEEEQGPRFKYNPQFRYDRLIEKL